MKRTSLFLLFLLAFSLLYAARDDRQLVILHTNDTHSTIRPISPLIDDTATAGRAGFLRRIALLEQERAATPDLLLFDSGDFSQGSFFYNLFKGEVEVELMNRMHYDAVALGNHEFDFGVDHLAGLLQRANFPVVCANYDFGSTPLAAIVKPYVIVERQGVKVGVFGLSPKADGLITEENFAGITYLSPVEAARRTIKTLREGEKCDVVVCLSHLGWNEKDAEGDQQVFAQLEGVDLVLGGHSHTYLKELAYAQDAAGHAVPVDQNGKHAVYVGRIVLHLQQ